MKSYSLNEIILKITQNTSELSNIINVPISHVYLMMIIRFENSPWNAFYFLCALVKIAFVCMSRKMVNETNVMQSLKADNTTLQQQARDVLHVSGSHCLSMPLSLVSGFHLPAYKDGACTCYPGLKKDKGEKIEEHVFENAVLEI